MKENIVKNGARVISFAPDDDVTSNYEFNGTTHYDIHTDEGEEDLDVQECGEDFELVPSLT